MTSFGVYLTAPMVYQVIPGYLEWRGLPRAWISTTMTLGQMTEIAMLAVLPWLLRRFGVKGTMMLGICGLVRPVFQPGARSAAVAGRRRARCLHGVGIRLFHRRRPGLYRQPVRRSSAGQRPGAAPGVHVGDGGASWAT